MDDKITPDSIPADIEAGTMEYWKARARQSQKREHRSQREMTALIAELNAVKAELARVRAGKRGYQAAVDSGDLQPVARDYAPRSR